MTNPRRILVVDDHADALVVLAALLRVIGHEVQTARNGAEALRVAARQRPHVLLLDIGLPGMDGHEVCRRIRGEPWGRNITIAALTGWAREEDRRKSLEAGFDAHLAKPVALTALQPLFSAT